MIYNGNFGVLKLLVVRYSWLIAIAIFLALSILQTGTQEHMWLRTVAVLTDDSPVGYTVATQVPENFAGDTYLEQVGQSGYASIQNWLPILLSKYFDIDPVNVALVFVFTQIFLLYIAAFFLARTFVPGGFSLPLIFTLFLQASELWSWNLFFYGSMLYGNLATQLSLPFFIFGIALLIRQRWILLSLNSIVLIAIHPTMYVAFVTWMGFAFALSSLREKKIRKEHIALILLHGIYLAASMLVFQKLSTTPLERISSAEFYEWFSQLPHYFPWRHPHWLKIYLPRFLFVFALFVYAYWQIRKRLDGFKRATFDGFFIFAGFYSLLLLVGYTFQIVFAAQLMPLRWSYLFLPVFAVFLFVWIWPWFQESANKAWLAFLTLIPLGIPSPCVPLPQFPAMFQILTKQKWVSSFLGILVIYLYHRWEKPLPFNFIQNTSQVWVLTGALAFLGVLILGVLRRFYALNWNARPIFIGLLACVLGWQIVQNSTHEKQFVTRAENRNWMDVALYARNQTPPGSRFVIWGGRGWRAVSLRQAVEPRNTYVHAYHRSRRVMDIETKFLQFYGIEEFCKLPHNTLECSDAEDMAFNSLNQEKLFELSKLAGASHIVLPVQRDLGELFQFKEIYRNASFVIYQVSAQF